MPRVTCRCGQPLDIPVEGPDRIVCPRCSARIRVRRDTGKAPAGAGGDGDDGFIRFDCPCGRRLKVRAGSAQESGLCPDCGRVVAIPDSDELSTLPPRSSRDREVPTEEMGPDDLALLERWAKRHLSRQEAGKGEGPPGPPAPSAVRTEAGLRVCPRCGRPVHLGAVTCRECGADVPKR